MLPMMLPVRVKSPRALVSPWALRSVGACQGSQDTGILYDVFRCPSERCLLSPGAERGATAASSSRSSSQREQVGTHSEKREGYRSGAAQAIQEPRRAPSEFSAGHRGQAGGGLTSACRKQMGNSKALCRVKAALVQTQEALVLRLSVDSALAQLPGPQESSGTATAGRCP